MKTLNKIFTIAILLFVIFSCDNRTEEQRYQDYKARIKKEKEDSINNARYHGFQVLVIDSCEYLIKIDADTHHSYGLMSHKGNCKFCKENGRD